MLETEKNWKYFLHDKSLMRIGGPLTSPNIDHKNSSPEHIFHLILSIIFL